MPLRNFLSSMLTAVTLLAHLLLGAQALPAEKMESSSETQACIGCHEQATPPIVKKWSETRHAIVGVGCYECHKAEKTRAEAVDHNGFVIVAIVRPKECRSCHVQ